VRRAVVVACVGIGCGPVVAAGGSTTSESTSTTVIVFDESNDAGAGATGSSSDASIDASSSSTSTGGALFDPCLAGTPPDCPSGCIVVSAYPGGAEGCELDGTVNGLRQFCATPGDPIPIGYRTTYWAEIDGRRWFAFKTQPCVETLSDAPADWTECSGAAGEPKLCSCVCAQDVCGGEAERVLLEGCGIATPCGVIDQPFAVNPYSEDAICMLTALRERSPAALTVTNSGTSNEFRVYLEAGSSSAQYLQHLNPGICFGPLADAWRPAQRCELAAPDYFDACLVAEDANAQQDCLETHLWFTSCEDMPAVCP
jgi:hypothetical protein